MRIGIIGAGNIGGTLARLLAGAGHEVVVANSRGPETLAGLVEEVGERASAGTATEAAESTVVVVVAVPFPAYRELPAASLHGRVVVDAIPIAGDDPEAKATVARLIDEIGFDVYDVGPLAEGRRIEPGSPVFNVGLTREEVAAALA